MAPTFALSEVTLSTTVDGIATPFFGLQDAMNLRFGDTNNTDFTLIHGACAQGPDQNCTASCLNLDHNFEMFSNLETLHNCLVWPYVYVQDEHDGLTPEAADIADSFGLVKDSVRSTSPSTISNIIQTCLLDSCSANDDCAAGVKKAFPSGNFPHQFTTNLVGNDFYGMNKSYPNYFNPCGYINSPATADVAGIGVFISYAMQLGLILVAFVLALPWKKTAHSVRDIASKILHRTRPKNGSSQSEDQVGVKHVSKENYENHAQRAMTFDPASAITPAIVEFQKAQCYFMLATNIASLIIQDQGGLDPDGFQQIYNTYIFIKVIAIGGYLPVTFGLLTLRMLNKVGWYLLILSAGSVGVAIANLYNEQTFSPSRKDLESLKSKSVTGGPISCGGMNPITWCFNRIGVDSDGFSATNDGDGADDILVLCLVILALLSMEHFWNSPDRTNRKVKDFLFGRYIRRSGGDQPSRVHTAARWLWRYAVPVLFAVVVIIYIYCFGVFAEDLDWFRENEIYDPSWGFGQIVAILVWAPPVIEYIWESFRGIEDANDHRLPNEYEVRKKDE